MSSQEERSTETSEQQELLSQKSLQPADQQLQPAEQPLQSLNKQRERRGKKWSECNANGTSNTSPNNKRRKLTKQESQLLLNAYAYHNGDWNQILSDSKVKALKRPPEHLKRHVEYKRKEKNKQLSDSRGEHLRDDIINVIERETEGFDNPAEIADSIDIANSFQSDEEEVTQSPTVTPPLEPIHQVDKRMFDDVVYSDTINTSEDFEHQKENMRNRKNCRNLRIKQKAAERRSTIEEIRQQRIDMNENMETKNAILLMLTQMQQQMQQQMTYYMQQQQQQQQQFQNIIMAKWFCKDCFDDTNQKNN
jgi:hypothetical protein